MGFLNIPAGLGPLFQKDFPGFWEWLTEKLEPFLATRFATQGDMTLMTKQKGIVLTNAAGTVTKRVRLNDLGDGLIFEDV